MTPNTTTTNATAKSATSRLRAIFTLPRLAIVAIIICLLFQLQRGKATEAPKYAAPKFMKTSLIERINQHRTSLKLAALTLDSNLDREAQRYCEMVAKGNLQASLNLSSGAALSEVAHWDAARGVRRSIAVFDCNSATPALEVVRAWIANANDVANLESNEATLTGIGIVRRGNTYVVCEIFGSPQAPATR
jgi:uncharacterized protein YkwD